MCDKENTIFGTSHARTVWEWHSHLQWLCVYRLSVYFVKSLFVVWELYKYCGVKSIIFKSYLDWQFMLKMPSNPTYHNISGGLMLARFSLCKALPMDAVKNSVLSLTACRFSLRLVVPQADKTHSYFWKGLDKLLLGLWEPDLCSYNCHRLCDPVGSFASVPAEGGWLQTAKHQE